MTAQLQIDRKDLKSMIILFKTYQSLVEFTKQDIQTSGFDLNEFSVFEVIYHYKEITVQDIKDKILVANSSLTYILDKLQKKDLINRKKCTNDGRVTYISLTDKGLSKALEIFPKHYGHLKEIFNVLAVEEQEQLNILLKKVSYKAMEFLK